MAQYKVTFIFNMCRYGWSETLYLNSANVGTAQGIAENWAKARSKLLGLGVNLEAVRISDVDKARICGLFFLSSFPHNENAADTPWNGWVLNICSGDDYRRSFIVRGLPDAWIEFEPGTCSWPITAAMKTAVKALNDATRNGPFQLKVVLKNVGNLADHAIGALGQDADGFLTVNAPGVAGRLGEKLKMNGWKGPDKKLLTGSFTIKKVVGDTYTLEFRFLDLDNPGANTNGKAFRQEMGYVNIDSVSAIRPAKKSTGRAFFVSRGRRKNRR